ncbi:DNA-binding protein [Streptomyces canus]|uniref:DNA-binding protein n=1 Tax=Streptomyces canus TaxID=58343 RepID=UPI0036822906
MSHEADTGPQELKVSQLLSLPPTTDIETAAKAFGIGRTTAYHLARTDQFPCKVVRAGRNFRVVTADMLRVLCVPESTEAAAAA